MRGLSHVVNHVIIISTSTRMLFHLLLLLLLAAACFKYGGFVKNIFTVQCSYFFLLLLWLLLSCCCPEEFFVCAMDEWMNRSTEILSTAGYILCEMFYIAMASKAEKNDRDGRIKEREKMEAEHNLDQSIKRYEHERETCHAIDTQSEWKYLRTGNFFPMVTFSVDVEKRRMNGLFEK